MLALPADVGCSAYSGWKQPAVRPASAKAAKTLAKRIVSDHNIDDPLRDDNDLFRAFALQRPFYSIKGKNVSLNVGLSRIAGHRHIGAFFAVDLYGQGNGTFYQEIRFDLRPFLGGDESFMPQRRPAFPGKVGHHGVEEPYQDIRSFTQGPAEVAGRGLLDFANGVTERVGKFVD